MRLGCSPPGAGGISPMRVLLLLLFIVSISVGVTGQSADPGDGTDPNTNPGDGTDPNTDPGDGTDPNTDPGNGTDPNTDPGAGDDPGSDSGSSDCDALAFMDTERTLVNVTSRILTTAAGSRDADCSVLDITVQEAETALQTCSGSARTSGDSTSMAAYITYTQSQQLSAFVEMKEQICDDSFPAETSDECDIEGIEMELLDFYYWAMEYGRGSTTDTCSLLWTSHERMAAMLKSCSDTTYKVLNVLFTQISLLSSMACNPSTCNVPYAMTCINAARRILADTDGITTSDDTCRDLKLSLACTTNHTVDCEGSSHNLLFEHVHYAQARYRQICNVQAPEPSCTGRLSVENARWMLEMSTYAQLFPRPVICSFVHRMEWMSEDGESSPLSSTVLRSVCVEDEEPSPCQCTADASDQLQTINSALTQALIDGDDDGSICTTMAGQISEVFNQLAGCDESDKLSAVAIVKISFDALCGTLDESDLTCASTCNLAVCQQGDLCSDDVIDCMERNTAGCRAEDVLEAVVDLQQTRDTACGLASTPAVQLSNRPLLNGALQCMRPLLGMSLDGRMPLGSYCNAVRRMYSCLDDFMESVSDDRLQEMIIRVSRDVTWLIDDTVCSFMPPTGSCGQSVKADVAFVLDMSSSVGEESFGELITFVQSVVQEWDIYEDGVRVSVTAFSDTASVLFNLNTYDHIDDLFDAIGTIAYEGGNTYTDAALSLLLSDVFVAENGDREEAPNFCIIITDGMPTDEDETLAAAQLVLDANVTVFAVGVGDDIDESILRAMASDPKDRNVFTVANYTTLVEAQSQFLTETCSALTDYLQPFTPHWDEAVCTAFHDTIAVVKNTFLKATRVPFYSVLSRQESCSNLPELPDLSDCGDEDREYLTDLFESFLGTLRKLCLLEEPEEGCNVPAAANCLQELANAFVLPAVSPCSLFSKVEVCVQLHTSKCSVAASWPFTQTLEDFRWLAQSTCCKGPCDPAEAVVCLMDVQQMTRSVVPDWEAICSELDGSLECARLNVLGCDRCQQDTISVITGKLSARLKQTCEDPPETRCHMSAALECKNDLVDLRADTVEISNSMLCLKVYEARRCVIRLTEECEEPVRLSVSVDLEMAVASLNGDACRQDGILPSCYQVLVENVHAILAFNPLDETDPAYQFTPVSQPWGSPNSTAASDTGSASRTRSNTGSTSRTRSNTGSASRTRSNTGSASRTRSNTGSASRTRSNTGSASRTNSRSSRANSRRSSGRASQQNSVATPSWSMESFEVLELPVTYLGQLCREAQLAYACVGDSLQEFTPSSVAGLSDVLSATWALAWNRCEVIEKPLSCYTCEDAENNEDCNSLGLTECSSTTQMCQTQVLTGEGGVVSMNKMCVVPYECIPGCRDGICTYCCNSRMGCNEPVDGPLTGACDLLEISGCLGDLSSTFLETDVVNCSFVEEKSTCVEYSRDQCEANGEQNVVETLSLFMESSTVAQCRVQLTDPQCGVPAVSALGNLLTSIAFSTEIDFCPPLQAAEAELAAAIASERCDEEDISALEASMALIRSQLLPLDCDFDTEPVDICNPVSAYEQCRPLDTAAASCNFTESIACALTMTAGCQPVQRLLPLRSIAILASVNSCEPPEGIPDLPEDLQPFGSCLQQFGNEFYPAVANPLMLNVRLYVDNLVSCLLTTWDLEFLLRQPPLYKLYLQESLMFLKEVLVVAVINAEGEVPASVTPQCQSEYESASLMLTEDILLMLLRPFGSFSDPGAFCRTSGRFELDISATLPSCTDEEKGFHLSLLADLRAYRLGFCPEVEAPSQCSVDNAFQCLRRFTAFMDSAYLREEEVCRALNASVTCVKASTLGCSNTQLSSLTDSDQFIQVITAYQHSCADVVSEVLCDAAAESTAAAGCDEDALDECDSYPVSFSCGSIEEAVQCYKDAIGTCASSYQSRFTSAFSSVTDFAENFCGLDYTTWTMSAERCPLPSCDVDAALGCLNLDGLLTEDEALAGISSRVAAASSCLLENLAGCDLVIRINTILVVQHRLEVFITLFPAVNNLNLQLSVEFPDSLSGFMAMFIQYSQSLQLAFNSPQWDLLPSCWWLYDLNAEVVSFIEGDAFFEAVFERSIRDQRRVLDGMCNDPAIIGVVLNLPETEDDACPRADFLVNIRSAFFEASFTGLVQSSSRSELCDLLVDLDDLDVSACSAGRQRQMSLLVSMAQTMAGNVCEAPRYCSVERVQDCVLEVVSTIQGLGRQTSTQQVCRSVTTLDECVSRFSFRCDDASMARIIASSRSIRRTAVSVCGEIRITDPLPTCVDGEEAEACSVDRARDCSYSEVLNLLSIFDNDEAHCRNLQQTEECYNQVEDACSDSNITLNRLPGANIIALKDAWGCMYDTDQVREAALCTERCQLTEALECINSVSMDLQYQRFADGEVCSVVTTARRCVLEKTSECEADVMEDYQARLDAVLDLYADLTSGCTDVYTCLRDFAMLGRLILSTQNAPEPASPERATGSRTPNTRSDRTGSGSHRGSGSGSRDSAEEILRESSTDYLCREALRKWDCVEQGMGILSGQKARLLSHVFTQLKAVISDRCSQTVLRECYKCSNLPYEDSDSFCTEETESCGIHEWCSSQYRTVGDDVEVTRGCMPVTECTNEDEVNGDRVRCCSGDYCNTNSDFNLAIVPEITCFVEYAVDCVFTFAESMITSGPVECSSAQENLLCVARNSEYCPAAQGLYNAASQLILTLAQTTCVQSALSEGCSALAVSSMEAILSNAYSASSACSGLTASLASIEQLGMTGACTDLDLVALRESLSYASIITFASCNPDDCQPAPSVPPVATASEEVEGECTDRYLETSDCARRALNIYATATDNNVADVCSAVEEPARCAVLDLQYCETYPCLQNLIDEVDAKAQTICSQNYLAPPTGVVDIDTEDEAECEPTIVCNLQEAFACAGNLSEAVNEADVCTRLSAAAVCREENIRSCRSLQVMVTVVYFTTTLVDVLETCAESTSIDFTLPTDVQVSGATCALSFATDMMPALMNVNFDTALCDAAEAYRQCPMNMPPLMDEYLMQSSEDLIEAMASEEFCNSLSGETPADNDQDRRERQAGECSLEERRNAFFFIYSSAFMTSVPLDNRDHFCILFSSARAIIEEHLSEDCSGFGLNNGTRTVLERILEFSTSVMSKFCVETLYTPESCAPHLFPACMEAFGQVSVFSKTETGTLCRATEAALKCVRRFTTDCGSLWLETELDVYRHMRAVVGNTCSNLTQGLFCPEDYAVVNSHGCQIEKALACLPSDEQLGPLLQINEDYCSNLTQRLTCAQQGVGGCLQWQIDEAAARVNNTVKLENEMDDCNIDSSVTDYSTVCVAQEPCSLAPALECFELDEEADTTDCGAITGVRSCIDTALGSCEEDTEIIYIAYSLFAFRFNNTAASCDAPFVGLPQTVSLTHMCKSELLTDLLDPLEQGSKTDVCNVFRAYITCVNGQSDSPAMLGNLLSVSAAHVADMVDNFCQTDGVDISAIAVAPSCNIREAAFCMAREITWALSPQLLLNADNRQFCQRWHGQATADCVSEATAACDETIRTHLTTVADMTAYLVRGSRVCDEPSLCFVQEAFYHINQFALAVTRYSIDNDAITLCLDKLETEEKVYTFSATCSADEQADVAASLSMLTSKIGSVCEEVELPASPICPNLPSEQQRCSVTSALTCITEFNSELLTYFPFSLFWTDLCQSLEEMIRCAAFNTSRCSTEDEALQPVLQSLNGLRESAGHRCIWLSPDLCTRTHRCPVQDAGCDITLQLQLMNNPLNDVCTYIEEAQTCVEENTVTCTPAQTQLAWDTLYHRLDDLSIPDFQCGDNTQLSQCLLQARGASWQVLTQPSETASACGTLTTASTCLTTSVGSLLGGATPQVTAAQTLAQTLMAAVTGLCSVSDAVPCGSELALVMNNVFDWAIDLATADELDEDSFCSMRLAVLADIELTKELYQSSCNFTELDSLRTVLLSGFVDIQCEADMTADCVTAAAGAQQCLDDFDDADVCSSINDVLVCIAPAVGLCSATTYQDQLLQRIQQSDACLHPPVLGLLTSTSSSLYLSEKGGLASISFQFVQNYSSFSLASDMEVRVRAQVTNVDAPVCLGDDSAEIPQLNVVYDSNEACGVRVGQDAFNDVHTISLAANQDLRQDGRRAAVVSLYADLLSFSEDQNAWVPVDLSFKLAEYNVLIEDSDIDSVCYSVGPHTQTFDKTAFINTRAESFLLYRNIWFNTAVTVNYQQCGMAAICPCGVDVYAGSTRTSFDLCQEVGDTTRPQDLAVTMVTSGESSDMTVYRHQEADTYSVVLPTGTVVKVEKAFSFISVWVTASSHDFGKTEGLCGLFDGDAFNDFMLADGRRFVVAPETDLQYIFLRPADFIEEWLTSSVGTISSNARSVTPTCSCMELGSSSQCGVLSSVAACDFVQGTDITSDLFELATQTPTRRRRAVDGQIDYTTTIPESVGWPTPSNWTEEEAREYCERMLDGVQELRLCNGIVLSANATYSYTDLTDICVDNIRLSDTDQNGNFTTMQGVQKCSSLFLHNTTYQQSEGLRSTVINFFAHTCPDDCNGHGDCQMGVCHCHPGYVGGNCSFLRTALPQPYHTAVKHSGLCEVSARSNCRDIFVSGQGFIDSSYLSCHIQSVEELSQGSNSPVIQLTKVPAQLVTATMVRCSFSRSSRAHQTVQVAVSNDGISPGSPMLFTAHDPRCYACDPTTHQCRNMASATCEIDGRCYMPGEAHEGDDCLYCNALLDANNWSFKDLPECEVRRRANQADDDEKLAVVHIAVIAVGAALVVIIAIVAVACVMKRRQGRKSVNDQEGGSAAFDNPGYAGPSSSSGPQPQEFFNQDSIHKRVVTRQSIIVPTTSQ